MAETSLDALFRIARRPTPRVRLPVPTTPLVGRQPELDHLSALLQEPGQALTLVGAPGVGKSRLAVELAWLVVSRFRHGVCFVPLADIDPVGSAAGGTAEFVAAAVLGALDLRDVNPLASGPSLSEGLLEALADRSLLLVLDNFEHLVAGSGLVGDILRRAPAVRLVVTSRQPLGIPGEQVYRVDGLAFPSPPAKPLRPGSDPLPAVALFLDRARAARPDFTLSEANFAPIVDICARLDGLPLAISLTAGAVRYLSEADIAASLSDRLELPTMGGPQDYAHHRLGAALDWSWQHLDDGERWMLACLGVFTGGCTLPAATAVGHRAGDADPLATLLSLAHQNLLDTVATEGAGTRFVLLETIRRYALDRLEEWEGTKAARGRHCSWFVEMVESAEVGITAGPSQGNLVRAVQEDFANLASAHRWALAHDPEQALRIGAASWRLFSMWRTGEGRRLLDEALEAHPVEGLLRVRALNGAGVLARLQGDLDRAWDRFTEARAGASSGGDKPGPAAEEALATLNLGIVREAQGRHEEAASLFRDAAGRYRLAGDDRGLAHALNCLGVIALRNADNAGARDLFLDAHGRFRAIEDQWSAAWTATNLGWIAEVAGEHEDAMEWYEQSRKLRESVFDDHGLAISQASMGRVARRQDDARRAALHLGDALDNFHRLGDRRRSAACLGELAAVALQRNELALAARLAGAADQLLERLGVPAWDDEAALRDQVMAAVGARLGDGPARRARNLGRGLTLEDAMQLAAQKL